MKVKTSITLSPDVLRGVDQLAAKSSRSEVIEQVLRDYLVKRERAIRDARDIELMNKYVDQDEELVADVLRLSIPIEFEDD